MLYNFAVSRCSALNETSRRSRSILRWSRIAALTILLCSGLGCTTLKTNPEVGRFHHIGLFWLKNPGNSEEQRKLIDAAHAFARGIPEVISVSVGRTAPGSGDLIDASFDVCFVMTFRDRAALERYAAHPIHEAAARELFLPLSDRILFYDFIAEEAE